MKTIKEVLEHVLVILTAKQSGFICNEIDNTRNIITPELHDKTLEYFISQRPSETQYKEFFDNQYFTGGFSWWDYEINRKTQQAIEMEIQRRRFLELLISKL